MTYLPSRPQRRRGAITLEWILLVTVLIIGTVGGVAAVRNALAESGGVAR